MFHVARNEEPDAPREPSSTSDENATTVLEHAAVDIRSASLTIIAIGVAVGLLRYMADVFIPIVLGMFTFYALDPLVDRLQRWRVPRSLGAAVAILLLVGGCGFGGWALADDVTRVIDGLPEATQKVRAAIRASRRSSREPGTLDRIQQAAEEIEKTAKEAAGEQKSGEVMRVQVTEPFSASEYLRRGSTQALVLGGQAAMVLFLAYFLLLSDDLFKRKMVEIIGPTLARKKITVEILNQIAAQIERFLLVQILTSAIVGIATGMALWWLGVQQPGVWGVVAGVLNSVPYFGALIVTVLLAAVAFVQFGNVSMPFLVGGVALLITSLEGWVLTPLLTGRFAQINTVVVFISLIFWSWLWGIAGLLLAVPLTISIKVVCDRIEGLQPIGKLLGD
jgi:predicted PurR-regulated permease PerM